MRHAPPAVDGAAELQTALPAGIQQLLTREDVIDAELHVHAIAGDIDSPGDQRLRVDRLPVGIFDRRVEVAHGGDIGAGRNLAEQASASQIVRDDAGDVDGQLPRLTAFGLKAGDGKGQGFDGRVVDHDAQRLGARGVRGRREDGRGPQCQKSQKSRQHVIGSSLDRMSSRCLATGCIFLVAGRSRGCRSG